MDPQFQQLIEQLWDVLKAPLFELSGNRITLVSFLTAFFALAVTLYLSRLVEKLVRNALRDKKIDRGVKGSLERLSRYLVVVVGAFLVLDIIGINLTSLAAFGAVLMVGIGFGLQNVAQNFISGVILLIERPVKQGDIVRVDDLEGRVSEIRVRFTVIQTRDDVAVIVPNSKFVAESVVNESFSGDKIRIHVKVGVAYGSDTKKVKDTLVAVAAESSKVLDQPAPYAEFEDFGDSALLFDLRVWIHDIWGVENIKSDLRYAIDDAFRKQDIVIAFPQQDIHIKSFEAGPIPHKSV